ARLLRRHLLPGGEVHPLLQRPETRYPPIVEGNDFSVDDDARGGKGGKFPEFGVHRRDVVPAPACQPHLSLADRGKGANSVPFHSIPPLPRLEPGNAVGIGRGGEHRARKPRRRQGGRSGLVLHQVQQPVRRPVVVLSAGMDECVPARHPAQPAPGFGVENGDQFLALLPLLDLDRARVPDLHCAPAILSGGDLPRRTPVPCSLFSIAIGPVSQVSTVPPPYSPAGISPANLAYSRGWSSVRTASRFSFSSSGGPLGTAHETSTPPRSRRRSQCSRRASWRWITKIG